MDILPLILTFARDHAVQAARHHDQVRLTQRNPLNVLLSQALKPVRKSGYVAAFDMVWPLPSMRENDLIDAVISEYPQMAVLSEGEILVALIGELNPFSASLADNHHQLKINVEDTLAAQTIGALSSRHPTINIFIELRAEALDGQWFKRITQYMDVFATDAIHADDMNVIRAMSVSPEPFGWIPGENGQHVIFISRSDIGCRSLKKRFQGRWFNATSKLLEEVTTQERFESAALQSIVEQNDDARDDIFDIGSLDEKHQSILDQICFASSKLESATS